MLTKPHLMPCFLRHAGVGKGVVAEGLEVPISPPSCIKLLRRHIRIKGRARETEREREREKCHDGSPAESSSASFRPPTFTSMLPYIFFFSPYVKIQVSSESWQGDKIEITSSHQQVIEVAGLPRSSRNGADNLPPRGACEMQPVPVHWEVGIFGRDHVGPLSILHQVPLVPLSTGPERLLIMMQQQGRFRLREDLAAWPFQTGHQRALHSCSRQHVYHIQNVV